MWGYKNQMKDISAIWHNFAEKNRLSERQLQQFEEYYRLLIEANELFNITTITDLAAVIAYHFEDSFRVREVIDFNNITAICDVGTGGGFPGIPLKILFPHLHVTLLEVSLKKLAFLQQVIEQLGLTGIETDGRDWRSFLRAGDKKIDLFCSRASLHPDELIRIFSLSSPYKDARLVYWASREWQAGPKEARYLKNCHAYTVGERQRAYCIFSRAS